MGNRECHTCDIMIKNAPVELRARFKALSALQNKSYREMLQVLLDTFEHEKKGELGEQWRKGEL